MCRTLGSRGLSWDPSSCHYPMCMSLCESLNAWDPFPFQEGDGHLSPGPLQEATPPRNDPGPSSPPASVFGNIPTLFGKRHEVGGAQGCRVPPRNKPFQKRREGLCSRKVGVLLRTHSPEGHQVGHTAPSQAGVRVSLALPLQMGKGPQEAADAGEADLTQGGTPTAGPTEARVRPPKVRRRVSLKQQQRESCLGSFAV